MKFLRAVVCLFVVGAALAAQSVVTLPGKSKGWGAFQGSSGTTTQVIPSVTQPEAASCGASPAFEAPPGNVHDFAFQQSRLVKRNAAFDKAMPLVVCELANQGYVAEPVKRVQSPPASSWIYPVMYRVTATNTTGEPFTNETCLSLYHYDICRGDAGCLVKRVISDHQWAQIE